MFYKGRKHRVFKTEYRGQRRNVIIDVSENITDHSLALSAVAVNADGSLTALGPVTTTHRAMFGSYQYVRDAPWPRRLADLIGRPVTGEVVSDGFQQKVLYDFDIAKVYG